MAASADAALDTAIAALQAIGNVTMTLVQVAIDAGTPKDAILDALYRLHEANGATISQPDSLRLLASQVQTAEDYVQASGI